jgi:tRNA wybutosine-synthesizing protein 2
VAREEEEENVLRSPAGLRMLFGDWGGDGDDGGGLGGGGALWVATRQNGIAQVWAPRWTMFSRGNVKEKGRLLAFHDDGGQQDAPPLGEDGVEAQRRRRRRAAVAAALPPQTRGEAWAVDLYAGIGYFAFSYARLGMRVLCWELNAWSVEGLRRGARANGWGVRVVRFGAGGGAAAAQGVSPDDDAP